MKSIKYILSIILILGFLRSEGQVIKSSFRISESIYKGDTVVLEVPDFYGNIQWQESEDLNNWEDIYGGTSGEMQFIADSSLYYRAQITTGICDAIFSDTIFVSVTRLQENLVFVDKLNVEVRIDSITDTTSVYIYSGDIINQFKEGDVILSTTGEGYMRLVDSLQYFNDSVKLFTSQARLTDVFESCYIEDSITLRMSSDTTLNKKNFNIAKVISLPEGMTLRKQGSGIDISNFVLVNAFLEVEDPETHIKNRGNVKIEIVNGYINYEPTIRRKLKINLGEVVEFLLAADGQVDFNLNFKVTSEISIRTDIIKQLINESILNKWTVIVPFPLGPVPCTFEMRLIPSIDLALNSGFTFQTGFDAHYKIITGAAYYKYNQKQWTPIYLVYPVFQPHPWDVIDGGANLEASISFEPRLYFKIAAVAGPYIGIKPYIKAKAGFTSSDWYWKTYGGVQAKLGFEAKILGYYLANYYIQLADLQWPIDSAKSPIFYTLPEVTLNEPFEVSTTTAKIISTAVDDGGVSIIERGICYSTETNPGLADQIIYLPPNMGQDTAEIADLIPNTTYYFKAFATNSKGTAFSGEISFTTLDESGNGIIFNPNLTYGTLTDIDGNTYKTIQIGTQTWMAENLKTTKYNDGTDIPLIADAGLWKNRSTPAYCWYMNDESNYKSTYGALYNWHAVNTEKLCPTGWHVPTDDEWTTLTMNLDLESYAGEKLKEVGTTHWADPNYATNETGFTALPQGIRNYNSSFYNLGVTGYWWTSTPFVSPTTAAWARTMTNNQYNVLRGGSTKSDGLSIRCLKD